MSEWEWHRVLQRSSMSSARPHMVQADQRKLALYLVNNQVYATKNRCPHAAASLALGTLSDGVVTCPRHGWEFDVRSGKCLTMDDWEVATFPTRIVDGWIEVQLPPRPKSDDELMGFI